MKKIILSFITFICLAAMAQEKVLVDANAQKRALNGSFTGIAVSDGVDLYLTQGGEESVAVSASEEKYMERFKTEVVDGVLKIYYDYKNMNWSSNNKRKLTAYVSFKTLEKLSTAAGSSVNITGAVSGNNVDIKSTSGSRITGRFDVKEIMVDQSSGSSIKLSGTVQKIKIEVSSGAIFRSYDLSTDYCDAKATSGGAIQITINKELNAKANSGGGIKYKGEAIIKDVNVNSGGSVKRA